MVPPCFVSEYRQQQLLEPNALALRRALTQHRAWAGGMAGSDHHGAGSYEFDPLDFCNLFPEHLPWYREAELKHGRIAMLAYVGLVVPDYVRLPGGVFRQEGLDAVTAHNLLLGGGLGKGPMWGLLFLCGIFESLRVWQLGLDFELLTFETAGDFELGKLVVTDLELVADDIELGRPMLAVEEDALMLKTQELKHGRLAMIAFGGAITQAVSCNAHNFPFM